MRRRVIWIAGGVVALVLLAEGVLRVGIGLGDPPLARLDPDTEYELVPSAQYRRWGNAVEINGFGMRTRDHTQLPTADERRILLIGDSLIYGTHFLDQQETIAAVAERTLAAEARLDGCDLLALPMAASSWGPINQAAFLAREGSFGAVAGAILVSAHDLYDLPGQAADILPYRLSPSWTALGDAAQSVLERVNRPQAPPWTDPESMAARSLAALDAMIDQLRAAGIDPILVYQPTTSERQGRPAAAHGRFHDWAAGRNVRFLDLADVVDGTDAYLDAIHPSAAGAQRIAKALVHVLNPSIAPCSDAKAN